jgi:hypothetical protein
MTRKSTGGFKPTTVLSELTQSAYRACPGKGLAQANPLPELAKKGG